MRPRRSYLIIAAVHLSTLLTGQLFNRLVILADGDPVNPALQVQITSTETDFRHMFGVNDIHVILVRQDPLQERTPGYVQTIDEGLVKMQELCQDPRNVTVLAFVFLEDKGPSLVQVEKMLNQTQSRVKVLSNAYFRNTLSDLTCTRYAVLDYARGSVRSRDTIITEERKFPILPILGGGVLIGTGIILLSDGGGQECDPVDPAWQIPTGLCSDGIPVQLVITGTTGGAWSGTGVSSNGIFDPASGTQSISYTVGEGSCRESRTQIIEVTAVDAQWNIPSQPCEGETIVLVPVVSGGTWSGSGITQNPNGTADFVQTSAGTYQVSYTLAIGTCSAEESQTITVLPDADPSWVTPDPLCVGESVELTPAGTPGGTWSGAGVMDHGNGTATFTSGDAGSFSITYSAGTGGCQQSLTQMIEVLPNPDASWSTPSAPPCVGEEITLMPSTMTEGVWSGPGITDHGDGTATFIQNAAGTFSVTFTATLGDCSASLTQNIMVIDQADPSWIPPTDVCSGTTQTLAPSGTPGGTWSGQGVTDQGNGTASFASNEAGTFAVTYTVGTGACAAALTLDIVVQQTPDASWSPPANALCPGDSYELIPTGTTGGTWTGAGVTDHGNGTATFTQTESGMYDITYTVTNGPCIGSLTQTITVVSKPDASWSPPSDVCAGDQVTLVPTGTMGGIWSGNNIMDLGDGTALFSPQDSGIFEITYTIGQGLCAASLTQTVEVFPLPDATWSPPVDVCTGLIVMLVPQGTQGGTWSGEGVTDLGDGTANFSQGESGVYMVTYSVSTGPCTSVLTQNIQVFPLSDPSWTPPVDVCTGQEVILVPTGTPGGTWSGPGVTDLGNGTAQFLQDVEGTYAVTYSVGQGACMQMSTQDIIVYFAGDPSWTPPSDLICPGVVVELVAMQGTWSGEGVTDLGGGLGQFQTFDPGIYTITLTVGSGNCTASESHDVEVGDVDPPVIEIPASDMTVQCDGEGNITEVQDWLDTNGGAEASDQCSGTITWEHDFTDFPFDCGMAGIATVIFTATDEAGNTATTVGVFTIEDDAPPIFEGVPPDILVPCDNIPPPDPVIAFDECSGDADIFFEELPPGTGCPYEIVRIWTATDACGNESTAQQTIMATDDQAPEPESLPHDTLISCPGPPEQCIPPPEPIPFTDNCDSDPTVTLMEEIQPMPGGLLVIRCWTATDDCGNMSPPICQNIIIISEEPDGIQLQPQIVLTLNPVSAPEFDAQLQTVFDPENAHWEDPGLTFLLPDNGSQVYSVVTMPVVALEVEIPLETGVSLFAGSTYRKADLLKNYIGTELMTLTGSLHQQSYHAGLRFIPQNTKHLYFYSGLRYFSNRITDIRLTTKNSTLSVSDAALNTIGVYPIAGIGTRFSLGDIGTWEINANYGARENGGITSELKINITSLMHTLRKHRR